MEYCCIISRSKVAARNTPIAHRFNHSANELADAGFALGRAHLPVEIL